MPHVQTEVRVEGESQIPKAAGRVRRVWLEPNDASAFPPVLQSLLAADLIIVGPGSLYTSILPNILVRDLLEAIRSSRALKFFITNIANQMGETRTYTCSDHLQTLEEQIGTDVIDIVISNSCYDETLGEGVEWVKLDKKMENDPQLYSADLVDREHPWRHDAVKLAQALVDLYNERTGPLVKDNSTQMR